ncbi:MAG: Fic family protein [Clostridia bacterium]|nr:Fic family protein [Clostridia bacterium]
MVLENKLGITDEILLAREEERITKEKAIALWDNGLFDSFPVGTYKGLAMIHRALFEDIYAFAGEKRTVNLAKGNFRFAPVLYLDAALSGISAMKEDTFDQIIEKYVEMNIAHPFREGNGRATRIWLDLILKKHLGMVIDWQMVDKTEYLLAMERSPIRDLEIKYLLKNALTDRITDRLVFMKGIDASYSYEGYTAYAAEELSVSKE